MVTVSIACLLIVSLYLAKRLSDEKIANAALRDRVAALKRQLGRRVSAVRA